MGPVVFVKVQARSDSVLGSQVRRVVRLPRVAQGGGPEPAGHLDVPNVHHHCPESHHARNTRTHVFGATTPAGTQGVDLPPGRTSEPVAELAVDRRAMPVTMEQVRELLDVDEPDYEFAALLGRGMIPHLKELVGGDNRLGLASKAAYLAGLIEDEQSAEVLSQAVASGDALTRLAVASTLTNVDQHTRLRLAGQLLGDDDMGIRKMTLKSVLAKRAPGDTDMNPELMRTVRGLAATDPIASLRELASKIDMG